jgi:hypothetical protein
MASSPNSTTARTEMHTAFNYNYQIMKNTSEQDRKLCHAMHIMLLLVIRAQSQGSSSTAAIGLIVHPVF